MRAYGAALRTIVQTAVGRALVSVPKTESRRGVSSAPALSGVARSGADELEVYGVSVDGHRGLGDDLGEGRVGVD